MDARWLISLVLMASAVARAQPPEMSRNPRSGLLAEIDFATGSARLDASGNQLGRVAAWAYDNFDGLLVLDGHADRDGDIRLSWRRALRVRDQLVALGVDPEQIVVTAFGPERRDRARVAVWGTHNSAESMIAKRDDAYVLMRGQAEPRVRSWTARRGRATTARR